MSATIHPFPGNSPEPNPPAPCSACGGRCYIDGKVRCDHCDGSGFEPTPIDWLYRAAPEHITGYIVEHGLYWERIRQHQSDERDAHAMLRGRMPADPNRAADLAAMLDRGDILEADLVEYDAPADKGKRPCRECGGSGCVKVGHWHDWQVETCPVCDGACYVSDDAQPQQNAITISPLAKYAVAA